MKYKVLLYDGSGQGPGTVTFYSIASALLCAQYWQQTIGKTAYLWDGSTWTLYAPIP
jgi:hypothetical protein